MYCKMITTISLPQCFISITTHSYKIFFLWWELSRFTFLSNFQMCAILLLTVVTMLYWVGQKVLLFLSKNETHFHFHQKLLLNNDSLCSICCCLVCKWCSTLCNTVDWQENFYCWATREDPFMPVPYCFNSSFVK